MQLILPLTARTNLVSGSGTFILSANATLYTANSAGITAAAGTATGSIRTTNTRTFTSGANFVYNGTSAQVTGTGLTQNTPAKLTINNNSGITLSAATTISGLLTMADGTLDLANTSLTVGSLTGSGNITNLTGTAGARTIVIGSDNTSPAAYTGIISNGTATSVAITKSGTGIITLSGANTYTGATSVNGGTLKAGIATQAFGVTSAVILANTAGVVLDITGFDNTIGSLTGGGGTGGNVTLGAATLTIGSNNTSPAAYAGIINGSGAIEKTGTGTLILSGANTFTGTTTINNGILRLGATGGGTNTPLGTTGAGTTVSTGAALDLNGFTLGTAESLTLNGTGISSGGALINSSATGVTYSGAITLGSASSIGTTGNINTTGGIAGGNDLTKVGAGTLTIGAGVASLNSLNISAGTLAGAGQTINLTGNLSGAGTLTFTTGTLNIAGNNSFSGTFTCGTGTVNYNSASAQTVGGFHLL